jgi:hypothetical protein
MQLSGCASLLDFGAEEDVTYDRGYIDELRDGAQPCRGSDCDTEAESEDGRSPASYAENAPVAPVSEAADEGDDADSRVQRAIRTRDIILGMTRQDVMQSWGEPSQREVAGRGVSGHERWTYGSRYSLENSRTIIFENGRVAGWHR